MKTAIALVLFSACIATEPTDPLEQQTQDIEHWNELVTKLDANKTEFLGKRVQELAAAGTRLYWLDFTNFDPKLASWNATNGTKLTYGFSIGPGDRYNYRGSQNLIVHAEMASDSAIYHAYDATQSNRELGSVAFPKPPGAAWAAFATDGAAAYVLDESGGQHTLMKWVPGSQPTRVTSLESAGVQVGELWDFGIAGNTMIFIESGRIWKLDIAANKATWLKNNTEASGAVDFRDDGVLFTSATGLEFFDYKSSSLIDLKAKINANPFKVNTTFASANKYLQDFARWRNWVLYIGNSGLFAYDIVRDKIQPILLSPNSSEIRIDYRYPVVLDDGSAFVTGLTSTSGATGADGPTYKIDLKAVLN